MRALAAALLLLAAGCSLAPPGLCSDDAQCGGGRVCTNGVCVGCDRDGDCRSWQACAVAARACLSLPGRCTVNADCEAWEVCDPSHTCVLAPGRCVGAADCVEWKTCAGNFCVLEPGRCDDAADCLGYWPSCGGANTCQLAPPGGTDVLLWGTLSEGLKADNTPWEYDVIMPVLDTMGVRAGFTGALSSGLNRTAYVEPQGWMAYADMSMSPSRIRSFRPDPWRAMPDLGGYPTNASADDPIYATSACADDEPVERFVLREGTGEHLYACGDTVVPGAVAWFDAAGVATVPGTELKAWNASGAKLGYDSVTYAWVVWGTDEVRRPVSGYSGSVVDRRANGDGFWVAVRGAGVQLWRVGNDGVATYQATYAAPPPQALDGITSGGHVALDRVGNLFSVDQWEPWPGVWREMVVRYPADGTAADVVYDEHSMAQSNSPTGPPFLYYSPLVRGP